MKAQPDPDPGHWAGLYDEGVSTIEVGPREVTGLDVADGQAGLIRLLAPRIRIMFKG